MAGNCMIFSRRVETDTSPWTLIHGVLSLNYKDVGIRYNEGPNVWYLTYTKPISLRRQLRLQESVKYSPKLSHIISPTLLVGGAKSVVVLYVCGEWSLRRLIQRWSEASQAHTKCNHNLQPLTALVSDRVFLNASLHTTRCLNRPVSQMPAVLAACRELAVDNDTLRKPLCIFGHKT